MRLNTRILDEMPRRTRRQIAAHEDASRRLEKAKKIVTTLDTKVEEIRAKDNDETDLCTDSGVYLRDDKLSRGRFDTIEATFDGERVDVKGSMTKKDAWSVKGGGKWKAYTSEVNGSRSNVTVVQENGETVYYDKLLRDPDAKRRNLLKSALDCATDCATSMVQGMASFFRIYPEIKLSEKSVNSMPVKNLKQHREKEKAKGILASVTEIREHIDKKVQGYREADNNSPKDGCPDPGLYIDDYAIANFEKGVNVKYKYETNPSDYTQWSVKQSNKNPEVTKYKYLSADSPNYEDYSFNVSTEHGEPVYIVGKRFVSDWYYGGGE